MQIDGPRKRKRVNGGGRVAKRRFAPQRQFYGRYAGRAAELKFFDTIKGVTATTTAGVILDDSLVHIVQGVTESNRIGRKCTLRALHLHGTVQNDPATVLQRTLNSVRIILYWDKQANKATAAVTDILQDTGTLDGFNSFYKLVNSGRFRILMDKRIQLRQQGVAQTAAGSFSTYLTEWTWNYSKQCNIPLEFNGAAGVIGEITSNNIGIFAICSNPDDPPLVGYTARARFSDQ